MTGLALKTLLFDWRRFAPAAVAVGFSGLLVLLQAGLILGVFSLASVYVTKSSADLWVGFPGVQSIDLGRPIGGATELFLRADPRVAQVEPFYWGSGEWRTSRHGMVNVYIVGLNPAPDAMVLSQVLPTDLRAALGEPDAVLVDRADLRKLETAVGGLAEINGHRVRIVGVTDGLRALGGVNVIASAATARRLDPAIGNGEGAAYFTARLNDPAQASSAVSDLRTVGRQRGFEPMASKTFADRSVRYWLGESGAGVAFVFGSAVAILVAVIVTSQTLAAAVAASLKDYAALRALGFTIGALRAIVLAQTAWIAAAGVILAGVLAAILAVVARWEATPLIMTAPMVAGAAGLVALVAFGSGLWALRRVARADPAALLL
ncbi:ABC transporter permease [Caulobacter sp. BK020]|uniref:ABC transporter permease n=1 Tax=Caulobacter sp. BK020 TaxID=2512117 RepID=UPI0010492F32|nr:ABC transporter permease [Caulobacter sp. BK020]TCS04320.1 putative ABC transport system permease protein [Caulobacter sp. BK020]